MVAYLLLFFFGKTPSIASFIRHSTIGQKKFLLLPPLTPCMAASPLAKSLQIVVIYHFVCMCLMLALYCLVCGVSCVSILRSCVVGSSNSGDPILLFFPEIKTSMASLT